MDLRIDGIERLTEVLHARGQRGFDAGEVFTRMRDDLLQEGAGVTQLIERADDLALQQLLGVVEVLDRIARRAVDLDAQACRRLVDGRGEFVLLLDEMLDKGCAAALDGVGDHFAHSRDFGRDLAAARRDHVDEHRALEFDKHLQFV